jgi:hypothetical protein
MATFRVPGSYYEQFDADHALEVPAEAYGGWKQHEFELSAEHTAVVLMHAWDEGTPEQYPGWWRACEWIGRAQAICANVLPGLLSAVRASTLPLFHVASNDAYVKHLPGYQRTVELAGPEPPPSERVAGDDAYNALIAFRPKHGVHGTHNAEDINRGFSVLKFAKGCEPLEGEPIAKDGRQLFALCKERGINHLIYSGFCLEACLLGAPGGMYEMQRYGVICSVLREATTAVENKETAREEWIKQIGLWRVALGFGYVFGVDDLVAALPARA